MKHIWSILCEKASIDPNTQVLSLSNCVEEISFKLDKNEIKQKGIIFVPINFQLVTLWLLDGTKKAISFKLKLEVFDPAGNILSMSESNIKVLAGYLRYRNILTFSSFPISTEGRYNLRVSQKIEDKKFVILSEIPMDVKTIS